MGCEDNGPYWSSEFIKKKFKNIVTLWLYESMKEEMKRESERKN